MIPQRVCFVKNFLKFFFRSSHASLVSSLSAVLCSRCLPPTWYIIHASFLSVNTFLKKFFDFFNVHKKPPRGCVTADFSWWRHRDLNSGHCGYEPHALANWAMPPCMNGADNQDWTGDLILTKDTLYRLSYISDLTFGCGDRTWTCDLRVMSPTSYRLLHPAILYRSNVLLYFNTLPADKKLL